MANEYLLSLTNSIVQPVTYNNTTSGVSGVMTLSANQTLNHTTGSVGGILSGNSAVGILSCIFTTSMAANKQSVSATNIGVYLSQGSIYGPVNVYGKVTASTFTPATSTITATIQFNDPNYRTTVLYLSTNLSSGVFTADSDLDNPFYALTRSTQSLAGQTAVYNGLTSQNVFFRTIGRQVRTRQFYEG